MQKHHPCSRFGIICYGDTYCYITYVELEWQFLFIDSTDDDTCNCCQVEGTCAITPDQIVSCRAKSCCFRLIQSQSYAPTSISRSVLQYWLCCHMVQGIAWKSHRAKAVRRSIIESVGNAAGRLCSAESFLFAIESLPVWNISEASAGLPKYWAFRAAQTLNTPFSGQASCRF